MKNSSSIIDILDYFILCLLFLLPFSGAESGLRSIFLLLWCFIALSSVVLLLKDSFANKKYPIFIFLLYIFLSFISLLNFLYLPWGNFFETLTISLVVPLVYGVSRVYKDRFKSQRLAKYVLLLGVMHGVFALIQIKNGVDPLWNNPLPGGRPSGVFSWGAPVVGSFVGFSLIFFYALSSSSRRSFTWLSIFGFSILILLISGNRSLLLIHILVFFMNIILRDKLRFLIGILFLALLITNIQLITQIVLIIGDGYLTENQLYRLSSLSGGIIEEQQGKRIATWIQTLCAMNDSVLFGYPIGSYSFVLEQYLYCAPVSEGVMPHPHSFLLELVYLFGYLGGSIVIISLWYALVRNSIGSNTKFSVLVLLAFASPLNVTHGIVSLWWLTLLCIAFGYALSKGHKCQI